MRLRNLRQTMALILSLTSFFSMDAQTVERTTMQPMNIIYMTDTAKTTADIATKMGKAYGALFALIGQLQLKAGKTMAIYNTAAAPWFFDIAVEVNSAPKQLTGPVQFKTLQGGDAIVVHYKGPYEQMSTAYAQIAEWLKKNGKQRLGQPMEIYLNSPSTVKDANELRTDVYQLIQQ
ncbi:MAG: GyrI-like domain-containing protein [Flavisolibacter sp.]